MDREVLPSMGVAAPERALVRRRHHGQAADACAGQPMTLAARRLAGFGISDPRFTRPVEVVKSLLAVQAQDYLGALWAIGLRTTGATEADVERAIANRAIVRTWPMRGTLHFVTAADARWVTELC